MSDPIQKLDRRLTHGHPDTHTVIENNRGGKLTAEETGEKYQAWYKAILSHPTLLKTMSDAEHYEPIYGRYLRDEAQSEAAKALRAGRVIP